ASEKKLEQYGVWVKVKPREVTETPELEESFELSDLETPRAAEGSAEGEENALTAEEEKLLDELETELSPEETTENVLVPEEEPLLEEGELPDIESVSESGQVSDEELPELEEEREPAPRAAATRQPAAASAEVEVTLSEGVPEKDHFDDLEALESELSSVATKPRGSSAEILARIEEELRSIRTDLTQLRSELSGLRATAAETTTEAATAEPGAQGGFFDEDEDETIALTGDELDNILNTAEITEEAAETPRGEAAEEELSLEPESEAPTPQTDILSYETPVLEEDKIEPDEDTLVLTEEAQPLEESAQELESLPQVDELPAELVLDELVSEPETAAGIPDIGQLPEIDLEGIPELETEPLAEESAVEAAPLAEAGSETIDLETLDLGEEPTVVNAVPEQVEELEALPEAEAVEEKAADDIDALADEVDLEALAAEAEELEEEAPSTPVGEDLEIGELEALTDEEAAAESPDKEIEIAFEGEGEQDAEALTELTGPEIAEPAEQILEAEEVKEEPAAAAPATPGAEIPDNLKDEIRTVLKYMDHLLEALPDEKIQEFASSDYFVMYKKLFEDLGLGE
ncbi:MAG: hypothetical protein ABSF77_05915, partial [Spirochaetia bacterium]